MGWSSTEESKEIGVDAEDGDMRTLQALLQQVQMKLDQREGEATMSPVAFRSATSVVCKVPYVLATSAAAAAAVDAVAVDDAGVDDAGVGADASFQDGPYGNHRVGYSYNVVVGAASADLPQLPTDLERQLYKAHVEKGTETLCDAVPEKVQETDHATSHCSQGCYYRRQLTWMKNHNPALVEDMLQQKQRQMPVVLVRTFYLEAYVSLVHADSSL